MSLEEAPAVVGELVVQNGKRRGTVISLRLPVTVIGSGETCDVRVTGPGLMEVHAIITHTPVGPVLRSCHPDQTMVNGVIVSTRILKQDDEVTVGPCIFRLRWTEEEFIRLEPAPSDEAEELTTLWKAPADDEWNFVERQAELHAQEQRFARLYQERQLHLIRQREELKQLRAAKLNAVQQVEAELTQKLRQAHRTAAAARQAKLRARTLYRRFTKRLKTQRHQQDAELHRRWQQLEQAQAQLAQARQSWELHHTRQAAQLAGEAQRVKQAWELLAEGQRRLLADRQATEAALKAQQTALEAREAVLAQQENINSQSQTCIEQKVQELLQEIQRLELRANASRQVVQQLEEQRQSLEQTMLHANTPAATLTILPAADIVPLDPRQDRDLNQFLTTLAVQERELSRDRQDLHHALHELHQRAADLHDQRLVVAEQLGELLAARQAWQSAQLLALDELEQLARGLDERERMIQLRYNEVEMFEQARRRREDDLQELQQKLEAWQLQLTSEEAELHSRRSQHEAELQAKWTYLHSWEQSLTQLRSEWANRMTQAIEPVYAELDRLVETGHQLRSQQRETRRIYHQLLQNVSRVAALSLSVEQVRQELFGSAVGSLAQRRLRVFQKYWERHFEQAYQTITVQLQHWEEMEQTASRKLAQTSRLKAQLTEHQQKLLQAEQELDQARLTLDRERDELMQLTQLTHQQAQRPLGELKRLRTALEDHAARLIHATVPTALPGWGKAA